MIPLLLCEKKASQFTTGLRVEEMMEASRNDQQSMVVPSSSSAQIMLQEETLMKYFSGMIQASFGTPQSTKRTNGQIRVHWRVSVSESRHSSH